MADYLWRAWERGQFRIFSLSGFKNCIFLFLIRKMLSTHFFLSFYGTVRNSRSGTIGQEGRGYARLDPVLG